MIDSFKGHYIDFVPWNVQIVYFKPNLTPFIQPFDAEIIWYSKAHYWHAFSMYAIDLEEAGEDNIYKINLLEAITMAWEAWTAVEAPTIEHF